LWVYPVALFASIFVAPFLARLPLTAHSILSTALITIVMRLAVGPLRSRLRARRSM
ncbi:hypothetical protein I6F37_41660, partial [Bradyrhizobium sp. NBAIM08]|nr:hypothetical protein [Bradyrhizobium sp. NBAIM08]